MTHHTLTEAMRRVAEATVTLFRTAYETQEPAILRWDWQPGVGLLGLLRASAALGDRTYQDYVTAYIDRLLDAEIVSYSINGAIMFAALARLLELSGQPRYEQELRYFLRWMLLSAPRCQNDCLEHSWTDVKAKLTEQAWVDTLFMAGIVLAEGERLLGKRACREEVIRQFVAHQQCLQDPQTGLFRHLYDVRAASHLAGAFWGRGNGWMAASAVEVIERCGPGAADLQPIAEAFRRQMAAIAAVQAPDGRFHTVLDDPATYLELSATAALGYAALKGVRLGLLEAPLEAVGRRALQALLAHIAPSGIVTQVSAETSGFIPYSAYNTIPLQPRLYGQALALLLLAEAAHQG